MQIAIPNSQSGIDTNKLINDLLEAEKQPSIRLEEEIDDLETQKNIWRETNNAMKLLDENSKKLYSFNNPFNERSVESNEPLIAVADGRRGAALGEHTVFIKKVASADRWLSNNITDDYNPPKGEYSIAIGEKIIDFRFTGNTLESLIEAINKHGGKNLKASIIKQGSLKSDKVVLFESQILGKKGKMKLNDQAELFAKEISLIGRKQTDDTYIELNTAYITEYISEESLFENSSIPPISSETELKTNAFLNIKPGGIGKIVLNSSEYAPIFSNDDASMNLEVYMRKYHGNKDVVDQPIAATLENITLESKNPTKKIPVTPLILRQDDDNNSQQATGADNNIFSLLFNDTHDTISSIDQDNVKDGYVQRISIPISDIKKDDETISFIINNPLPSYKLITGEISFSMEEANTDTLEPLQPIDRAKDAVVNYNGIDLSRDTNTIDDIIPGITLNLKRADADTPVVISVSSNAELIKNDIISFVGSYNQLMRDLSIYTKTEADFLDTLQFNSIEERETAEETLGILSSEFSLTRFMTQLQSAVNEQYNNSTNDKYSSLRTIGIASNIGNATFNLNTSKFLDIDETELDNAIATDPDGILALFGIDTNNDVAIDYGVAFKITEALDSYIQINGINTQKQTTIQAQIDRDLRTLDDYERRLVRYETDLRRKYGNMEQTIQQLKEGSNAINNLSINNNNN